LLQSVENQLSTEDSQFIEIEQLGTPLGVYRLNSGYPRFVRIAGMFLFFLAGVLLIIEILGFMKNHQPHDSSLVFTLFVLPFVSSLLFGWLLLWIEAPRAKLEHIIICEEGLLQTGLGIRSKNVETVRWANVRSVSPVFLGLGYSIICRGGKTLTISLYQDAEGLFNLIKEQIERS
jgi:hypothetical protein